jgi:hypothetical protein
MGGWVRVEGGWVVRVERMSVIRLKAVPLDFATSPHYCHQHRPAC